MLGAGWQSATVSSACKTAFQEGGPRTRPSPDPGRRVEATDRPCIIRNYTTASSKPTTSHAGASAHEDADTRGERTSTMTLRNIESHADDCTLFSRREMLRRSAALTAGFATLGSSYAYGGVRSERGRFAYVGTYNSPVDGGAGNGNGIYLFKVDSTSGALGLVQLAAEARNPSWLALHPSGRFLYSVNEITDYEGESGSVSAYAVDAGSGELQLINRTRSEGAGPAHLSVDASGRYAFVANYFGGTLAVLPIAESGRLGRATFVQRDSGSVGSTRAVGAPTGSFAISGHDKPHVHMIEPDPRNRYVLHTDLGQDRLYVQRFDAATGKLSEVEGAPVTSLPQGAGPRHFVFHTNGRWLYSLQEEASNVAFFVFDSETGFLHLQQTVSTLPTAFQGTSFTSEIVLSPDGRFLYAANRLHDSIAAFSLGLDGRLTYVGETTTEGDYPRHLSIHPSGTYLYACNQRSDAITCFRLDRKTGRPVFTGQYTAVGSPACIIFAG